MKVRLVAEIDAEVKKEVQIKAIETGQTLAFIVERALCRYLGVESGEKAETKDIISQ